MDEVSILNLRLKLPLNTMAYLAESDVLSALDTRAASREFGCVVSGALRAGDAVLVRPFIQTGDFGIGFEFAHDVAYAESIIDSDLRQFGLQVSALRDGFVDQQKKKDGHLFADVASLVFDNGHRAIYYVARVSLGDSISEISAFDIFGDNNVTSVTFHARGQDGSPEWAAFSDIVATLTVHTDRIDCE